MMMVDRQKDLVRTSEVHFALVLALVCSSRYDKCGWIWEEVGVTAEQIVAVAKILTPCVDYKMQKYEPIMRIIVKPELKRQLPWLVGLSLTGLNKANVWNWMKMKALSECGTEWIQLSPINIPFAEEKIG